MDTEVRDQIDLINQKLKELSALYHGAAGRAQVPDGEMEIWSYLLNSRDALSQLDLCEALSLPKQTVNSLVNRMARKGYVTLEHAPGTRNRKVIRLTEEGRAFGEENVRWIFEAEHRAMEHSDPDEIKACVSMLNRYIERLRQELRRQPSPPKGGYVCRQRSRQ